MNTTVLPLLMNYWAPTMVPAVMWIRQQWIDKERAAAEKKFRKENGREPSGDEKLMIMQARINHLRRMGLR